MCVEVSEIFAFTYVCALIKKTYLLFHPPSASPPAIKNEPLVEIKLILQTTIRLLLS